MTKGLIKVGEIWYFQKSLPTKLGNLLGQKIFKKSLEIDSKSIAVNIASELDVVLTEIFKEYKRISNCYDEYTSEDMKKLLLTEFYRVCDKYNKKELPTLVDRPSLTKSAYVVGTLIKQFITYLDEVKHLRTASIRQYNSAITSFFETELKTSITDIRQQDLSRLLVKLKSNGSAVNTVKEYLVKLKTFYKWVSSHKDIHIDQKMFTLISDFNNGIKSEQVRDALTLDQLRLFFGEEYPKRFKNANSYFPVLLAYTCGLRISEAAALQVRDLSIYKNRYVVQIRDGKTDAAKRYVILPNILNRLGVKRFLDDLLKQNPDPTSSLWGTAVTGPTLSARVTAHLLAIGIKTDSKDRRYTEHSLRHSFSTKLISATVDERYAKKYFGHKGSSLMTSRYMIQNPEIDDILAHVDSKLDFTFELQDLVPFDNVKLVTEQIKNYYDNMQDDVIDMATRCEIMGISIVEYIEWVDKYEKFNSEQIIAEFSSVRDDLKKKILATNFMKKFYNK